jgi:two-component system nitrogen regulation response regulator NtrX
MIKVNVRVVAATNKDLRKEIERGNFREDLYPPPECDPHPCARPEGPVGGHPLALADHFIQQVCSEQGITPKEDGADKAVKELQKLPWTGNVRELRNVIERLVILSGKRHHHRGRREALRGPQGLNFSPSCGG